MADEGGLAKGGQDYLDSIMHEAKSVFLAQHGYQQLFLCCSPD